MFCWKRSGGKFGGLTSFDAEACVSGLVPEPVAVGNSCEDYEVSGLCAEVRATGPSERRVIVAAVLSMCRFEMNRAPRTAAVAKRPGARRCQADIFARYSFGRSGSYASMGGPTAVV